MNTDTLSHSLRDYASVSGKCQMSLRNDKLTFEHHKKVAPLKDEADQHKIRFPLRNGDLTFPLHKKIVPLNGEEDKGKRLTKRLPMPNHRSRSTRLNPIDLCRHKSIRHDWMQLKQLSMPNHRSSNMQLNPVDSWRHESIRHDQMLLYPMNPAEPIAPMGFESYRPDTTKCYQT